MTSDLRRGIIGLLPRLRRFAYALTCDPDKGDDLVQEGCARAFAHLEQWRSGTRLDSWMYKIIHNVWLDQKRASKVRGVAIDLDSGPELAGVDGRDVTETRLTLTRVLDVLRTLPPEQQALITLVGFEGCSYQEAAEILGIPLGTATSRLIRGRQALYRKAVEGSGAREGGCDKADG